MSRLLRKVSIISSYEGGRRTVKYSVASVIYTSPRDIAQGGEV